MQNGSGVSLYRAQFSACAGFKSEMGGVVSQMNKKRNPAAVLFWFTMVGLALAGILGGCGKKKTGPETGYKVYYVDVEGIRLKSILYQPKAQTFEELTQELAGQLAQTQTQAESAMKNGVKIQGFSRGIDALRIDFSEEYYTLDNIQAVLLRAAVTKTFSQVPGVTQIMLTVNDAQIVDSEGNPVDAMDGESFIDTQEGGINSYQYATLTLYFPSSDGSHLVQEKRSLEYSSNMVLENVVMEELLKGPQTEGLTAPFPGDTTVQSVTAENGLCKIDFDQSVNQSQGTNRPDAMLCVYALVNSICQTCDEVDRVALSIGADSNVMLWNQVSLNQVFQMNLDYTRSEEGGAIGGNSGIQSVQPFEVGSLPVGIGASLDLGGE